MMPKPTSSTENPIKHSTQPKTPPHTETNARLSLPLALLFTLAMVIVVRESAVMLCQALGYASAANIVGMITMFIFLIIWRIAFGIPEWVTRASNTLLVDSGFAFLPVSAGAGLLLFALGDEFWGVVITMTVSTLLPLWVLAKLANLWLGRHKDNNHLPSQTQR